MFRSLDPGIRPWAQWMYDTAELNKLRPRITSTFRSVSEQRSLWEERMNRVLPVAFPGCSQHNYGLAWDMVTDNQPALGDLWNRVGGRWGGASDPVHYGVNVTIPPPFCPPRSQR